MVAKIYRECPVKRYVTIYYLKNSFIFICLEISKKEIKKLKNFDSKTIKKINTLKITFMLKSKKLPSH